MLPRQSGSVLWTGWAPAGTLAATNQHSGTFNCHIFVYCVTGCHIYIKCFYHFFNLVFARLKASSAVAVPAAGHLQSVPVCSLVPRLTWMSVGRTNPPRAGNFTSEASSNENVDWTPPHVIHNWILRHINKAWTLSKLGQVTLGRS